MTIAVYNLKALKNLLDKYKKSGKKIGIVPTMGALHSGHISLIDNIKPHCDIIVVSIFINSKQFAPGEDYERYPRCQDEDISLLTKSNVDIAYLPTSKEIYPDDFSTKISVGAIGEIWEGEYRPHFFDGVAVIINKLFWQIQPNIAIFGEKDYQQLAVIRQIVKDFSIPIKIIGAKTMRDHDGLALSSRNRYLSTQKRQLAPIIYQALQELKQAVTKNDNNTSLQKKILYATNYLLNNGFERVDYIAIIDKKTLQPITEYQQEAQIIAAAWIQNIRLIDNISL